MDESDRRESISLITEELRDSILSVMRDEKPLREIKRQIHMTAIKDEDTGDYRFDVTYQGSYFSTDEGIALKKRVRDVVTSVVGKHEDVLSFSRWKKEQERKLLVKVDTLDMNEDDFASRMQLRRKKMTDGS